MDVINECKIIDNSDIKSENSDSELIISSPDVFHLQPESDQFQLGTHFIGQELSPPTNSFLFRCKVESCVYVTQRKHLLKKHLIEFHKENYTYRFTCPHCTFVTDSRRYLKLHVSTIHEGVRKYVCPYCDFRFTQTGGLKKHIRVIHESGKSFVSCNHCRFRCEDPKDLENHIRSKHLGEKPFMCDICGSCFRRNPAMLHHKSAVHFKEKPHACVLCDFKCSKRFALKIHLQSVHAQIRPYKCHLCENKAYSNLKALKYHIDGFHFKIFPQFYCFYCPFISKQKDYLKKHIWHVHRVLFLKKKINTKPDS